MSEPTFTLGLAKLKKLSEAVCELDAFRPKRDCRDARYADLVSECHAILIEAMGDHAALIYDCSEETADEVPA